MEGRAAISCLAQLPSKSCFLLDFKKDSGPPGIVAITFKQQHSLRHVYPYNSLESLQRLFATSHSDTSA